MKFYIFLACILIHSFCNGQTNKYHPFLHDRAEWNDLLLVVGEEGHDTLAEYAHLRSIGDSIIGDTVYIKIFRDDIGEIGMEALLFDDTLNQKVYLYSGIFMDSVYEFLLYDFNLPIGTDLTDYYDFRLLDEAFIYGIDSIEIDGNFRKRIDIQFKIFSPITFDYVTDTTYWIEGIGNTAGLHTWEITPIHYQEGIPDVLACYYENDTMKYSNLDWWFTCDSLLITLQVGINNIQNESGEFIVYPNPADEKLYIKRKSNSGELINISLMDCLGMQIYESKMNNTDEIITSDFPPGIYVITIYNADLLFSTKIIFTH